MAIVHDACQSGSFLPDLAPPPDKERIMVVSTTNDEPALFASRGNVSFSSVFWTNFEISGGFTLPMFLKGRHEYVPKAESAARGRLERCAKREI